MPELDIELFIKEIKASSLRNFTAPAESRSFIQYSERSIQINVDSSDIPVPELVLKLPTYYDPEEKVRWTIPFNYKEFSCTFALQKSGLFLYVSRNEQPPAVLDKAALEIIKKIKSSINRVEKTLLIPYAQHQIESGNITIANHYLVLRNRYVYFREKAENTLRRQSRIKNSQTNDIKDFVKVLNDKLKKMFKAENELFYNTIAMLDAYFSFLEHLFVLIMPLCRDNIHLVDFIGKLWAVKYKLLFDISSNLEAKSFYDKLDSIKERFRNFYAHGAFGKGGTSLFFHFPNIGAIPAQLSEVKKGPHFDFFPIQKDNFKDICRTIDDFEKWLKSEGPVFAMAIKFVESGLDVPCDKQSLKIIRSAMASDKKLDALIQRYSYLWEMHTNMDY